MLTSQLNSLVNIFSCLLGPKQKTAIYMKSVLIPVSMVVSKWIKMRGENVFTGIYCAQLAALSLWGPSVIIPASYHKCNINHILTLMLKTSLNPEWDLWSCEDKPTCPHIPKMSPLLKLDADSGLHFATEKITHTEMRDMWIETIWRFRSFWQRSVTYYLQHPRFKGCGHKVDVGNRKI